VVLYSKFHPEQEAKLSLG